MAIDFPGAAGDDVDCGNPSQLQITGALTVMSWVCVDSTPQNAELVSKQTSGDRGFSLQTDDDPPSETEGIFIIAKTSSTTMQSGWASSPLLEGVWEHICGQFVPSTAVQIWRRGVMENENTTGVPATMHDSGNNVTIAGRPDNSSNFDGKMEDVRIYNRNLSAAEMATIHASRGHDRIIDGLVARWMMNEGAPGASASGANSIKDVGPDGLHGTPGGSPTYFQSELSMRG